MLPVLVLLLTWSFASGSFLNPNKLPKFSFESLQCRPTSVFTTQVLAELERVQQSTDPTPEILGELLRVYKTEIRNTCSIIQNYNTVKPEVDRITYYIVQVMEKLARINSDRMESLVIDYIDTGSRQEIQYLLSHFSSKSDLIQFLARVLCYLIKVGRFSHFKMVLEACPQLVNVPVDPKRNGQRLTPLAIAAKKGDFFISKILIAYGADVNASVIEDPNYGVIPVLFCALGGASDSEIVAHLICTCPRFQKGACLDSHGLDPVLYLIERGCCPENLDYAATLFGWSRSCCDESSLFDAFGFALWLGRDVHADILTFQPNFDAAKVDKQSGSTYLILAARYNKPKAIRLLYSLSDDCRLRPGHVNYEGTNAIITAITYRSYEALEELLKHTKEDEINDENGLNPLAWSVFYGDLKCVQIVLKHPSVSVDAFMCADFPGLTVFDYAQNIASPEIIEFLINFKQKHGK